MRKILLLISFIVLSFTNIHAQNWNEIIKAVASDREESDIFGVSVSISGDYAIIGTSQEDEDALGLNTLNQAGSAYIFERNGLGVWNEVQKLVASDRDSIDFFANSVSISGDYAIVGAAQEDEDALGLNTLNRAGSAYIFERNGLGVWNEVQKLVASDRDSIDRFGNSVSISGDYAIVGADLEDKDTIGPSLPNVGSAYVFERNGVGVWNEVQKLVASDRGANDQFGCSVSVSDNYAIIGALEEDEDALGLNTLNQSGSAYVFERNGVGVWNEVQKLVASDRDSIDGFGNSVSISGDYALVGAFREDEDALDLNTLNQSGSAYIFERNGVGVWNEAQKLVASDRDSIDSFGYHVSISGDYAIIGATGEDEDVSGLNTLLGAGSAYKFERNVGGSWNEVQKLVASDRASGDFFGVSVAISDDYAIIGAVGEDEDTAGLNTLSFAGSVYIFGCLSTVSNFNVTECQSYIVPSGDETYTTVGTYPVMDTIPNGCGLDSIMTITLTILPAKTGMFNDAICFGDSIVLNGTVYNAANPTGFELISNVGPYMCDSTVAVILTIFGSGGTTITGELTSGIGLSTQLMGSLPTVGSTWSSASPEVATISSSGLVTGIAVGTTLITYVDGNGCEQTATVTIDEGIVIFVPNIFSPNGDGNNDVLYVRGSGVESLNFVVYDRWGEKVFETERLDRGWDGTFGGEPMNNAGFVYYLKATFKDGTETEQKGGITLVR